MATAKEILRSAQNDNVKSRKNKASGRAAEDDGALPGVSLRLGLYPFAQRQLLFDAVKR